MNNYRLLFGIGQLCIFSNGVYTSWEYLNDYELQKENLKTPGPVVGMSTCAKCSEPACAPSPMCRVHLSDLDPADPQHGPTLRYFSGTFRPGEFPKDLGKFYQLTVDKHGVSHVYEVPESFYGPNVLLEGSE